MKLGLLLLLGFLWSARLTAIKAAGVSGISVHVTVTLSTIGIAAFFTGLAMWRRSWPPMDRTTLGFYLLSGMFGFILPFLLETIVAPNLPVFVFVVIIATMPIITLSLATVLRIERPGVYQFLAIGLGFVVALLVAADAFQGTGNVSGQGTSPGWTWVLLAFGVPILYAANTLFIASRWPVSAKATQVAQAQVTIVAGAAVLGTIATGSLADWGMAANNPLSLAGIALFEGLALLVYLKITRDYGASFVSLANYVSMVFAAVLGVAFFGDRLTWVSALAAVILVASLTTQQMGTKRREAR